MAFPPLRKTAFLSIRPNWLGTMNSAQLWNTVDNRTDWIRAQQSATGGWAANAADGAVTQPENKIWAVALAPFGRPDPVLRIYMVLNVFSGEAAYTAQLQRDYQHRPTEDDVASSRTQVFNFGPWHDAASDDEMGATLDTSGTYYAEIDLTEHPEVDSDVGAFSLRVDASATAAVSHQVESLSALAMPTTQLDGEAVSGEWLRCSTVYAARADRSDNVAYLRRLRDMQAVCAGRDPRVLALHCFGGAIDVAETGGGFQFDLRRFVVSRGHDAGRVKLAVYVENNFDGIAIALGPADGMEFNAAQGFISGEYALAQIPDGVTGWQVIDCDGWGANTVVPLTLLVYQANKDASSGTVSAFALFEERDPADYVASDSALPAALVDKEPYRSGQPIVANWAAGSRDRRDDRKTTAENIVRIAAGNAQCLALDQLDAAGPWRGYWIAGADVNRVMVELPERAPELTLYVDGNPIADMAFGHAFFAATPGTAYELELRDADGQPASTRGVRVGEWR